MTWIARRLETLETKRPACVGICWVWLRQIKVHGNPLVVTVTGRVLPHPKIYGRFFFGHVFADVKPKGAQISSDLFTTIGQ